MTGSEVADRSRILRRGRARVLVVVAGLLVLVAVIWSLTRASGPAGDPATAARTSFPDLPAPTGDSTLPGLATAAPPPGAVVQVPGPFDDRFRLTGLRFDGSSVAGTVEVTSDVSELLELEVQAGFYDDTGALLGTASEGLHAEAHPTGGTSHPADGPPEETFVFRIAVPADLPDSAASAAVGVPVLVNE